MMEQMKNRNSLYKNIPIKINEEEVTAYVDHIQPFLMGYRVLLSLGSFPIKEYIYKLNNFYIEEQRFEIEIIDGIDFKQLTRGEWRELGKLYMNKLVMIIRKSGLKNKKTSKFKLSLIYYNLIVLTKIQNLYLFELVII